MKSRNPWPTFSTMPAQPDGSGGVRTIVTYLGTDFILPNGCPLPECDENNRFCRRDQLGIKEKYDNCLA